MVWSQRQGVQQRGFGAAQQQLAFRRVQQVGARIEHESGWFGSSALAQPLGQRQYSGAQLLRCGGFGQVQVSTVLVASEFLLQRVLRRDHDDANVGLYAAQALGQAETAFAGQVEVENRNVGDEVGGQLVQSFGAVDADDVMAARSEGLNHDVEQVQVVFDHQQFDRWIEG